MRAILFLFFVLSAGSANAAAGTRVWIDTDPACGIGAMTDPDDCFALLYLLAAPNIDIAGISTTFGNASLGETTTVARELLRRTRSRVPLHIGAEQAIGCWNKATNASDAIAKAATKGPITLIALGPLTNLATALTERPALASNIVRVIAVMGKEPGEIFHPAEGSPNAMLGHGPIFTDLNFAKDPRAARIVFGANVEITLVPYAAGKTQLIGDVDLMTLAGRNPAAAWVADGARGWLSYWRNVIGRDGFYPFDLVASIAATTPASATCRPQAAAIRPDDKIGWFGGGPMSLLFESASARGTRSVTVCRALSINAASTLNATLARQEFK